MPHRHRGPILRQAVGLALLAVLAGALRADATKISVGGRLLTSGGDPVVGASIELLPEGEAGGATAVELVAPGEIRGRTSPDGVFRLFAPTPGLWRVSVEGPDGGVWEHPLHPLLQEVWLAPLILGKTEPAAVRRSSSESWAPAVDSAPRAAPGNVATQRVSGRVLDAATGRPLSGAWVWQDVAPDAAVRTAATGHFDVRLDGAPGPLLVAAPGYLVATRQLWTGGDVGLQPAATVAGQVIDAAGRPAGWAELRLHLQDHVAPLVATFCGPDGRFLLGGIPPGQVARLRATAENGLQAGSVALEPLLPGKDRRGLRVVMSRTAAVSGRVVDGGGRAIAGARVRLVSEPEGSPRTYIPGATGVVAEQLSATDGRFELRARAGHFQLEIERAGFARQILPGFELATAGGHLDLGDLLLESGVDLSGRVLDQQRAPISGAKVEVRTVAGEKARRVGGPWLATTDARGSFFLDNLPPAMPFEVVVRHPDYVQALLKEVEVPGPPLEILLRTGAGLSGRVVDSGGRGISEATVVAVVAFRALAETGAGQEQSGGESRAVDSDGRFRFRNLSPGTVTVRASASGFRATERSDLELSHGASLEDIELVLESGAALHGTVRGADGSPANGALVTLQGAAESPSATLADAEGRFAFESLSPGPVEVKAEHPGYRQIERPLDLETGTHQIDLVLPLGLSIVGRVADARGAPFAGVELTAQGAGASLLRRARSNGDGSFRLAGLAPGPWDLVARAPGFISGHRQLELAEASIEGLELTLDPGGAVRGDLIGLKASDLPHVEVAAFAPQHGSMTGTVEATGSYRIEGLCPGPWTVVAAVSPGSRQARAAVHVDGDTELDLDFTKGLVLSGRVLVDGDPLAGADVELFGLAGQGVASGATSQGGTFELSGLDPGTYSFRLRQRASGFAFEQAIEMSTDRELDLELGTARVTGRVLAADMSPLVGAEILLQFLATGGTRVLGSHTDSSGFFSLPRVPAGDYLLHVRVGGRVALEERRSVAPGIDQNLVLQVDPTDLIIPRSSRKGEI